jgi:hypothetical protein
MTTTTAARMTSKLGAKEARRLAVQFATYYPRGHERRLFWLDVEASISDAVGVR